MTRKDQPIVYLKIKTKRLLTITKLKDSVMVGKNQTYDDFIKKLLDTYQKELKDYKPND